MFEKVIVIDVIEIIQNGTVFVREKTYVFENGNSIAGSYDKHSIAPGDDYSTEDAKVQAVCAAVHTPEVIDAYKAIQI
jgi:hypothetical protein